MVDTTDSKSVARKGVPVQVRLSVPIKNKALRLGNLIQLISLCGKKFNPTYDQ